MFGRFRADGMIAKVEQSSSDGGVFTHKLKLGLFRRYRGEYLPWKLCADQISSSRQGVVPPQSIRICYLHRLTLSTSLGRDLVVFGMHKEDIT